MHVYALPAPPSEVDDPVKAFICWFSKSTACCSLSISIIKGTINTKKAVPAIQAAFPVLLVSFLTEVLTSCRALAIILIFIWYIQNICSLVLTVSLRMCAVLYRRGLGMA